MPRHVSPTSSQGVADPPRGSVLLALVVLATSLLPRAAAQDPTYNVFTADFTMYSSTATTALGVSGLSGTTYTHSNMAFAVVQNSTQTGWTTTITANHMRISARWSVTFANQTTVKPMMQLYKSASYPCFIHKGQSPLCTIDLTQPVGNAVALPLPSTISSTFSVMDIDLNGQGWVIPADTVYWCRFHVPVQTGPSVGIVAYQLGRVTGFNRMLTYLTASTTSTDPINGGAEPFPGTYGVTDPDSTTGALVHRLGFLAGASSPSPTATATVTPTATATVSQAAAAAASACYGSLSVGGFHGLATAQNTTRGFGENALGQTDVPSSLGNAVLAAAAGGFHSCALYRTGSGGASVQCWGAGGSGAASVPSAVAADGGIQAVAAGGYHSCAILSTTSLACWGANGAAQVSPLPQAASTGVGSVSLGVYHGCLVQSASGAVSCWGKNDAGQVSGVPQLLSSGPGPDTHVACGGHHCCAWGTDSNGSGGPFQECWGATASGQTTLPVSVPTTGYEQMCAGGYFSCGLGAGSVTCWGSNAEGETTVPASATDGAVAAIACGWYGACALKTDGGFVCWGGALASDSATQTTATDLSLSTAEVTTASATSGAVVVSSGAASGAGADSGAISIASGGAASGASGPIVLHTGSAGSTRGAISLLAPHVEVEASLNSADVTTGLLTIGSTALTESQLQALLALVGSSSSATHTAAAAASPAASAAATLSTSISPTSSATTSPSTSTTASPSTTVSPTVSAPSTVLIGPDVVTTFAGSGAAAFADGQGTSASFNFPCGVAVDSSSGRVYVADGSNHRIRAIDASGAVTTLAGSGTPGFADGQGTAAMFNNPFSVAYYATSGVVYVADTTNHRIRAIGTNGAVATLAGSGTSGFVDAQGTAARFASPHGIVVNGAGVIYVADMNNQRIRVIDTSGAVTTLAGSGSNGFADGPGLTAKFSNPQGIAYSAPAGALYVADTFNNRVRIVDLSGAVATLAGTGAAGFSDGPNTTATFNSPYGLAVEGSSGTVYVADTTNHRIRMIDASGAVTTLAGDGTPGFTNGQGTAAQFNYPIGVAINSASGELFVADYSNALVRKVAFT